MVVTSMAQAEALRARIGRDLTATLIEGPDGDWELRDGRLVNRRSDFFTIIGRHSHSRDRLLIRQPESALVGLVVTGPPTGRRLLLSARAEPGLHGNCHFSTTVQSTPSNYLRKHGGRPTPFVELFLDPQAALLDSFHYDWGRYYHRKSKRFVVVAIEEQIEVSEPLVWVSQGVVDELLRMDYTLTTDLRVLLSMLAATDAGVEPTAVDSPRMAALVGQKQAVADHDVPLDANEAWTISPQGIATRDGERGVVWVRVESTSREVDAWIQPLMVVRDPLLARLSIREGATGPEAAVVLANDEGMDQEAYWHPAPFTGGTVLEHHVASAEGGRFWHHDVELELVAGGEVSDGEWVALDELESLALTPFATSVELRLLLGMARLAAGRQQ